jgi:formate-dependent nitrite reductase cytochrome c552 subunit
MNKRLLKFALLSSSVLMLLCTITAQAVDNPHVVSKQDNSSTCTDCHISMPKLKNDNSLTSKNLPVDLSHFSKNGVDMCSSCHDLEVVHKTGVAVDFPVPSDLPLNQDNEIICLTCHYTHGSLDSDKPQASFSFMDRMVNAQRLHKSYLLRRNNSDGELCLICHNPNQGTK